jgi:hypothetical protein
MVAASALAACALDSKSLGEEGEEGEDGESTADEAGDDDGGPPPPAVERRADVFDDITPTDLAIAPDGSFYVVGARGWSFDEEVFDGDYESAWIARFDASGELLWEQTPAGMNAEPDVAVALPEGVLVLVGGTFATYDTTGALVSSVDVAGDETFPRDLAIGSDGTIFGAGIGQVGADSTDAYSAAYDPESGEVIWDSRAGTGDVRSSTAEAIAILPNGDIVVGGGQGVEYLTGRKRAFVARLDAAGQTSWVQTLTDGEDSDDVVDLAVDADGTIHAVVEEGDVRTIRRFDGDGTETWDWDSPLVTAASAIALASDGRFAITDGLQLDDDDPGCPYETGPGCPVALRVASHDADGSAGWFDQRDDCAEGIDVGVQPNGDVVVVGACPPALGDVEVAMGLFVYAP